MRITTKLFTVFFIGFSLVCFAQLETYNYKRTLENVSDEWHQIILPEAVFGNLNPSFSDLRIYGITHKKDTIEAPYFLKILSDKISNKTVPFKIINKTKSNEGYYYTFQLHSEATINQIKLNFETQNFDWKVDLQGSQNQNEWFTILNDYRILAIKNTSTNFKFTTLQFSETKYRFYRLFIKHNEQPELVSAQLYQQEIREGSAVDYSVKKLTTEDDKQLKTTTIDLELEQAVALSHLNIEVSNTFDYYRPLKIEYRRDSTKTENGWMYDYKTITSGTLNSLEPNHFKFRDIIAKHLRLTIYNEDNQALTVSKVLVKGHQFQMIGRFTEKADYSLVYGKSSARLPNYDITKFETKVPEHLKALKVGTEELISKPKKVTVKPLFENSYWLWGIIGVAILIIGGFTLRMLQKS